MSLGQGKRAEYLLRSAAKIAREASESLVKREFERVVRKTQEALEMLLKGRLVAQGVEPAKSHDLVDLAGALGDPAFPVPTTDLSFVSDERIPSYYGSDQFIPDEEYDESDADRCLAILRACGLLPGGSP